MDGHAALSHADCDFIACGFVASAHVALSHGAALPQVPVWTRLYVLGADVTVHSSSCLHRLKS